MLKNKIVELETEYGLKPSDDLTIIRLISSTNLFLDKITSPNLNYF